MLRSSLAMALVTGRPFVIENIRAGRKKPGLMRQHLVAVKAAGEVSGGQVKGAAIGSTRLEFHPGTAAGGDYTFRVGTAGSTTFEGGKHNPFAPHAEILDYTFGSQPGS